MRFADFHWTGGVTDWIPRDVCIIIILAYFRLMHFMRYFRISIVNETVKPSVFYLLVSWFVSVPRHFIA